jgi:Flp pilus assembly protein TadB
MIERLEERRERHSGRSRTYRIAFAALAFALLLAGVVLSLPLVPGPGLPLIAVALAMLALEFAWAERLLRRIAHRVEQVEERVGWRGIAAFGAVALAAGLAVFLLGLSPV